MKIQKKEWLVVATISLLAMVLALSPIIYGYLKAPENHQFGAFSRDDEYVHWHYATQAKEGRWLFENRYTLEAHPAIFTLFPDWLIGKMAALFNLEVGLAYNLGRVIYSLSLLLSFYFFIAYFFKKFSWRLLTFLLVCFSSGLGWLLFFVSKEKAPFLAYAANTPETLTFPILLSAHSTFSLILLAFCFYFLIRMFKEGSVKFLIWASFFGCWLIQSHPFEAVTLAVVPGVFLFFKPKAEKKNWLHYLIFLGLISLPIFYFLAVSQLNPSYREWTKIKMLSPSYLEIFLAFGLVLGLAVFGGIKVFSKKKIAWLTDDKFKFLVIWAATSFILVKMPFIFQRRLIMGVHLPLVILAGVGLKTVIKAKKKVIWLGLLLVLLTIPQNLYFISDRLGQIQKTPSVYYLSDQKMASLSWLEGQGDSSSTVLANPASGLLVPVFSGKKVFLGHWAQTNFAAKKTEQLWDFFNPETPDEARRQLLAENKIDFFYYDKEGINYNLIIYSVEPQRGKRIQELEREFDPDEKNYWELVFENEAAAIYRVKLGN